MPKFRYFFKLSIVIHKYLFCDTNSISKLKGLVRLSSHTENCAAMYYKLIVADREPD